MQVKPSFNKPDSYQFFHHGRLVFATCMAVLAMACSGDGRPAGALRQVSQPKAPLINERQYVTGEMVAHIALPGVPRNFAMQGTALYAFLNQQGLATVDISDPEAPRLASHLPGSESRPISDQHSYFAGLAEPKRLVAADRQQGVSI